MSIISNYVYQQPTSWVLRESIKSWSGNDFKIKDTNGQVVAFADGKAFSFSDTTVLNDASGQPLCAIKRDHFHMHQQYVIMDPSQQYVLATVRKKAWSWKPKIKVYEGAAQFGCASSESDSRQLLELKGSWTGRNFNFQDPATGASLASSHERYSNMSGWFFGKDEYELTVQPNVDCVLVWATIIACDLIKERERKN
eukprot:TRINITY_DN68163_c6_g14_i1.p1 TRINITY_DN68163_c6_g14~~TRINITY_DN68163_c6_g14_i1.p1  ORF type:complete len:197 (+),score=9.17 TRINITY_DN68163_c6_g14_i1:60-650(+)